MLELIAPAGIGDVSWIYSKIVGLDREIGLGCADWEPHRTQPFIDLLPGVKNLGYNVWEKFPRGAIGHDTDLASLDEGRYPIEANTPLERGVQLSDIFAKQATEYYYELEIEERRRQEAHKFLDSVPGWPRIGVYASSYHKNQLWRLSDWAWFVSGIAERYPEAAFYVIGAQWDKRSMELYDVMRADGLSVASGVGKHHIGTTLTVIDNLDYFFAYPSGLGIMAGVMRTPCMMWLWKSHPREFHDMYSHPDDARSGKHINLIAGDVATSLAVFDNKGAQHVTAGELLPAS